MATSVRDRLAVAEHDLREKLEIEQRGAPPLLLLSRFGFGYLDSDDILCAWPIDRIAGLRTGEGPALAFVSVRRIGEERVLCYEWEEVPSRPLAAVEEAIPLWLASRLGIAAAVYTGAAMSLSDRFPAHSLIALSDHIRWQRGDPLAGWPSEREGARFPQMERLYDEALLGLLSELPETDRPEQTVGLIRRGPSSATAAELKMFERLGADTVMEGGSSEAMAARHAGLRFLALGVVLDVYRPGTAADPGVLAEAAEAALPALRRVIERLTPRITDIVCSAQPEEAP